MAGIMTAMKSFGNLGTAFSNNPAVKAVQQAHQRKQAQAASQTAGVAGAASVSAAPPPPSAIIPYSFTPVSFFTPSKLNIFPYPFMT